MRPFDGSLRPCEPTCRGKGKAELRNKITVILTWFGGPESLLHTIHTYYAPRVLGYYLRGGFSGGMREARFGYYWLHRMSMC